MAGIKLANQLFAKNNLDQYCQEFAIPSAVKTVLYEHLVHGEIEVNLFGGNPEMIRDIGVLIGWLKQSGCTVNLTTTGRRLMRDQEFAWAIAESIDSIALSADDISSIDELDELCMIPLNDLYQRWKNVSWKYGQRQKLYEAIFVARWIIENKLPTKTLFNLVLHKGNVHSVLEMIEVLRNRLPQVRINPYPEQNAFMYKASSFDADYVSHLTELINHFISIHLDLIQNPKMDFGLVPRLHYWLILKAACILWMDQAEKLNEALHGRNLWHCYRKPGAARYVQFGKSGGDASKFEYPGGHLGCFWNNQTITLNQKQVWTQSPQSVANHVLYMSEFSQKATNPCWGCGFPRLVFDMISAESGLVDPELIEVYLQLRKTHVGF